MPTPALHLVVDAANVIGSRPDGWWRDRAGAARRLAGQLVAVLTQDTRPLARALDRPEDLPVRVHLVLEGKARVADPPTHASLEVVEAPADGDTTIVEVTGRLVDEHPEDEVVIVTADRALRSRVEAAGAAVIGPGTLLRALPG